MKYLVPSLAAAVLMTGVAAPAFAQDAPPTPVSRAPFTGLRAEVLGGYDHLSAGRGDAASSNGFAYGGQVGYDAQFRGVVVGVEGEVMGSTTDTRTDGLLTAGDRLRIDAGRDLYAGARVGFAAGDRALIYAKGGYTNARIEARYDDATTSVRSHQDLDGYRVGGGVEYQIAPTTYVKAEYRYSHYGRADGYDIDVDRHQVLAGLGVRF